MTTKLFSVTFYPPSPSWDDPAVIAARYEQQHTPAQTFYGKIYHDGSCSCADFKSHGRCGHAAAWESLP